MTGACGQEPLPGKGQSIITASHLLEYLFCPRFTYFEFVLCVPEHQEKRFKVVKGRQVHEQVRKTNPGYLRKRIGVGEVKSDVYLAGPEGERGIVDEILFLKDGSAAPLDYKYAQYSGKTFKNHRFQLIFYARLIQHNYGRPVERGFIIYTRSSNKLVEVPISENDYAQLDKVLEGLRGVIEGCIYPPPTEYKLRCADCCYKNICESAV